MAKIKLQIAIEASDVDAWRQEARTLGLSIGQWVALIVNGKLNKAEAPKPVHATAQVGSLWSRIHALTDGAPIKRSSVPALARKLEVPEKSVYAALHSRMASKRMVRVGDEYLSKGE